MNATSKLRLTQRPLRLLMGTVLLSLAATVAQTASAQGSGMDGMGGRGMGPGGPGMGYGAPHQMEHMLRAVNATPEQRAQIMQIAQGARAELQAQREAGRKLREQSQALFAQPTVDARAVETLRQQMLAHDDQASKTRMQLMLDVSRVLTPEQRRMMADRMAQRRALMERQRAERQAIEKTAPR